MCHKRPVHLRSCKGGGHISPVHCPGQLACAPNANSAATQVNRSLPLASLRTSGRLRSFCTALNASALFAEHGRSRTGAGSDQRNGMRQSGCRDIADEGTTVYHKPSTVVISVLETRLLLKQRFRLEPRNIYKRLHAQLHTQHVSCQSRYLKRACDLSNLPLGHYEDEGVVMKENNIEFIAANSSQ